MITPYLFRVEISLWRDGRRKPPRKPVFTGKLIKRLLISANPNLMDVFAKTRGVAPKLVHITPLYDENTKIHCLHTITLEEIPEYPKKFVFYVGSVDDGRNVLNGTLRVSSLDMYDTLLNTPNYISFAKTTIRAELQSIEKVEIDKNTENAVKSFGKRGKLSLIFSSPTLLRDPFVSSKYKSFLPSPLTIFSTPVYVLLFIQGKLTANNYRKILLHLHRTIGIPYSYIKTLKTLKIPYRNGSSIPALGGYVNLYMHQDLTMNQTEKTLHILRELIPITLALGVGTSRATEFGHVTLRS